MKFLVSTLLATLGRDFRFVPYGAPFDSSKDDADGRPTIGCDGRIPGGVTLELTHWTGNETPDYLYADTSTEMAINLAKQQPAILEDALVLNNHYDTDGVLSSWACLFPDLALQYADLLREGAEAGDFGEWSSDRGVKLDSALEELLYSEDDESKAYQAAFVKLPALLKDLTESDGKSSEHLWQSGFENAMESWNELDEGRATLERGPGNMVILKESPSIDRLSAYALHRGLVASKLWEGTTRILRVTEDTKRSGREFCYEKIGHGWVQKLVVRHCVPGIDDTDKFVSSLNDKLDGSGDWRAGGSGLVALCQCPTSDSSVEDVADVLCSLDQGCQ